MSQSNTDKELDIDNAAIKVAEYLYSVDTQGQDVPPELIEAISRLRQLVNEEFVAKDKQVSSQLIFDTLHPIIQRLITQARKAETTLWYEEWGMSDKQIGSGSWEDYYDYRIALLQGDNDE